ncbi:hypothetical protein V6N11_007820 [Hibiscus sabdariffa]|uniref:Reverse transcriptase zinc-binding domain-containing protein n=1 Tax=Hibiscus sabdariffa TaxID=183260 RepID=A0ABR2NJW6_9ROSI
MLSVIERSYVYLGGLEGMHSVGYPKWKEYRFLDCGDWDWNRMEGILPQQNLECVASIYPTNGTIGDDLPRWRWEKNGRFSTKSAYNYLCRETDDGRDSIWRRIWKLNVPQRVRVFVWLSMHERILTNMERVRRHCTESLQCEICHGGREDIEHVLRSCVAARGVWSRVIPPGLEGAGIDDEEWPSHFVIYCWLIWKRRCALILAPEMKPLENIIERGDRFVEEVHRAKARQIVSVNVSESEIQWKRPPSGWVKLNVDASVSLIDNRAGVGVVFRDSGGRWIWGAARSVGWCNALLAVMWAIHHGLLSRMATRVADRIATRGCNSECTAVLLPLPPMEIRELVEEELHNSNAVTAEFVR